MPHRGSSMEDGPSTASTDSKSQAIPDEVVSVSTEVSTLDDSSDFEGAKISTTKCVRYEVLQGIELPKIVFPLSQYEGWEPPLPQIQEEEALTRLLENSSVEKSTYADNDYLSFDLDDFTIYRDFRSYVLADEMTPLHEVAMKQGNTKFLFDGILRSEGLDPMFLRSVPFEIVSIGGYQTIEQHTVGSDIWIQSVRGRRKAGVWYRLRRPSTDYKPYHESFLWLADFGKHFVDFLSKHDSVMLHDFKADFAAWLKGIHGIDPTFQNWLLRYGKLDFRQAVVAHSDYLFKQALDIDGKYERPQLWREIGLTTPVIEEQPQQVKGTIVTPYVYCCFQNMEWGQQLQPALPAPVVLRKQQTRIRELGFVSSKLDFQFKPIKTGLRSAPIPHGGFKVHPGDVVSVKRDEETVWKSTSCDDMWYAFVQGIHQRKSGSIWLDVIWLYRPSDTVCANMTYLHADELFLSDHCNCGDHKIENTEVVAKVDVTFFSPMPRDGAAFFVRQTYRTDDEVFLTLREEDFHCYHRKKRAGLEREKEMGEVYWPGDTVLVETGNKLEPVEIVNCAHRELEVRELLRRSRDFNDPKSKSNELVHTDRIRKVHFNEVQRRCHIRFYTEYERDNGHIPPPYSRNGNGDAFYITCREMRPLNSDKSFLKPLDNSCWPPSLRQGFDPMAPTSRLRALNIFSGGGNFDRGLEEGSAVKNEWAVEWAKAPMLTYRANSRDPENMKLYWGSVNDFLDQSLRDHGGSVIARAGEVEFISAGSPCQGYALTNNHRQSEESLRNCSMIASVAAFIDHFRPKYAILENVTAMATKSDKNPFSQMLCALVGMGYQARILNLDAWSFGAPQSRSRLFILVAAPGLKLPEHPPLTHSHPPETKNRSLGEAANGLPFGNRRFEMPVFDFVTAAEGTKDLPRLGTAKVMSIPEPDHRSVRTESLFTQTQIELVPKAPRTQGLHRAIMRGWMAQPQVEAFARRKKSFKSKESRSWSRVDPKGLIPTITTSIIPACAFTGRIVHWEEDRLLTIKEARRAQGFPDHEVLIGRPTQQWKIVGNSVARQVALALGMALREACLENERNENPKAAVDVPAHLTETMLDNIQAKVKRALPRSQISNDTAPNNPPSDCITKHIVITERPRPKPFSQSPASIITTAMATATTTTTARRQDIPPSRKASKPHRIVRSKTSIEETTLKTTTITDRYLAPGESIPDSDSDSCSAVIISEHEWRKSVERRRKRDREVSIRRSSSTKRRRVSRVVLESDDDE